MKFDFSAKRTSDRGRVVLLFGGRGCEREISLLGAERFLSEAKKINFDLLPIFIDKNGEFFVFHGAPSDIPRLKGRADKALLSPTYPVGISSRSGFIVDGELVKTRIVFPLLHGDFGEDGVIQGLLSGLGMKCFGADNFTGAIGADKPYAKIIARSVGVPTLPEIVLNRREDTASVEKRIKESFGFPAFIKPARLGSSIGASLVRGERELSRALKKAFLTAERVMIEPAVTEKRELEVAYYEVGKRRLITPPAEIFADSGFYDFNLKYKTTEGVSLIPRASIDTGTAERIRAYTERLVEAISARHIARFDYFLLPRGEVYFNEVNTMPGMTATSLYSEMLRGEGIELSDLMYGLLEVSD